MALPVPIIVTSQLLTDRTKFMPDGMGFDRFVATWPIILPLSIPDVTNSGNVADPWRHGDNAVVTHILYRVIENRATPAMTMLDDSVRNLIVADTTQYDDMVWHQHPATEFWYQDAVFPVTEQGRHVAAMPTAGAHWAIDAKTKCYWVTAWLGVDADNILAGYDTTP